MDSVVFDLCRGPGTVVAQVVWLCGSRSSIERRSSKRHGSGSKEKTKEISTLCSYRHSTLHTPHSTLHIYPCTRTRRHCLCLPLLASCIISFSVAPQLSTLSAGLSIFSPCPSRFAHRKRPAIYTLRSLAPPYSRLPLGCLPQPTRLSSTNFLHPPPMHRLIHELPFFIPALSSHIYPSPPYSPTHPIHSHFLSTPRLISRHLPGEPLDHTTLAVSPAVI
jgi:hypothetical protein